MGLELGDVQGARSVRVLDEDLGAVGVCLVSDLERQTAKALPGGLRVRRTDRAVRRDIAILLRLSTKVVLF